LNCPPIVGIINKYHDDDYYWIRALTFPTFVIKTLKVQLWKDIQQLVKKPP